MKKMPKNIMIILAAASWLIACQNQTTQNISQSELTSKDSIVNKENAPDSVIGWREIRFKERGIIQRMAYADTVNFMHEKIYPCAKCFLRPEAATALLKANELAKKEKLQLLIFDCYRPKKYQQKMFDLVKNPDYVADPAKGSIHNRGLAVDIALADSNGNMLDFGTKFDDFSEKANVDYKGISSIARANRKKLQDIMVLSGFEIYKFEWWHFNYSKVTYPVDGFIWDCN